MKILIVEDEPTIRQTLQELLELNGHTVLAAADGPAGLELAKQGPEFIFCDIGLPGMNGFEVFAAVSRLPASQDIPFIFLTARANREDLREGMALGADDYITKPFTEQDIVKAIAARTRRLRPLRQRIEMLVGERRVEMGANWSHELLTPLNGILGGLELIEAEADHIQPGELRELLALIRASAERQRSLSRKLVYYFELKRLVSATTPSSFMPCAAAEAIMAGAGRAAEEENRLSDLLVRCDPATVPLAAEILSAAVAEVVANACRFSEPGQPVTVNGTRSETGYTLEIVDQGPGMPAEQCAQIGAFVQFDRGKREQQGLGLGLALARSCAEVAGGHLTLRSDPDRRGLVVTIDLPCQS